MYGTNKESPNTKPCLTPIFVHWFTAGRSCILCHNDVQLKLSESVLVDYLCTNTLAQTVHRIV